MNHDQLTCRSATDLAHLIRVGKVSSEEVVSAHLARIVQINPALNAVVQLAEAALIDAREADRRRAKGQILGPLHGVPFTVKDWIDVADLPCMGLEARFRDRIPTTDATVVARLKRAGGIVLGKTNTLTDNPVYGRTNNPHHTGYSPAGSSSGEAVIIAACGSPLGLGSDSGGSIRQPAHNCGIAGLKPTTGRVPLTGHFPFISAVSDPRTVIGPLARSVEDLALALSIIQGPDWQDASVVPMPLGHWQNVQLADLRVAFYTHHEHAAPSPETAASTRKAAQVLSHACKHVDESIPDRIEEAYGITRGYWNRPESVLADTWQPEGAMKLTSEEVEKNLFEWDRFRRALIRFMGHHDVILTPVADMPARPHEEPQGGIPYTLPYSLTGYPCAVVRVGTSNDGMPIGVQIVARPWRDDVALAVAKHLEDELDGWQPPAKLNKGAS